MMLFWIFNVSTDCKGVSFSSPLVWRTHHSSAPLTISLVFLFKISLDSFSTCTVSESPVALVPEHPCV